MAKDRDPIRRKDGSEQPTELGFVSYREVLDDVRVELGNHQYEATPSLSGKFCFFDFYKSEPLNIYGLNAPSSFRLKRLVRNDVEMDRVRLLQAIEEAVQALDLKNNDEEYRSKLFKIFLAFNDNASDTRSVVAKVALGQIGQNDIRIPTFTGKSNYFKVVPPREWFPEQVQGLDARSLLTIFDDAEAEALMLIIGRVAAGPKGQLAVEGMVDHSARSFALITGEAGIGKSTLIVDYLKPTLQMLGYRVELLNPDMNKFGWGPIALSDLALIDDLTEKNQAKMLAHPNIKSVVTNGDVKVEDKGVAAVNVKSRTVIMGLSNHFNVSDLIGLDEGIISRMNPLQTRSSHDLEAEYNDSSNHRTKEYWEALAKQLNVTPTLLTCWLFRCCLDKFLAVTGHTFDGEHLEVNAKDSTLEATLKYLRSAYRLDTTLGHTKELTDIAANLVALSISRKPEGERYILLDKLPRLEFSPDLVLLLLQANLVDDRDLPDNLRLVHLGKAVRKYLSAKIGELRQLHGNYSYDRAFELVMKELKSDKAFGYPTKPSFYYPLWQDAKRRIPSLVFQYATDNLTIKSDPLRNAVDNTTSLL